jgi:hypothetical protein
MYAMVCWQRVIYVSTFVPVGGALMFGNDAVYAVPTTGPFVELITVSIC